MSLKNKKTAYVTAALFTAVITVFSQISIPLPIGVPVTLQIFAVALTGLVMGAKWGLASVATYILLGAVGLPVFSSYRGGFQILLSPAGGFILGFLGLVFLCGISVKFNRKGAKTAIAINGVILCHLCGVIQYSLISKVSIFASFITVSLPFLAKDIILVILALYLSKKIKITV